MTALEAVVTVNQGLSFAIDLLMRLHGVSQMIEQAQAEGRDLTSEEVAKVVQAREAAREAALAAVQ